jgi:putative phage-type endonuclease
MLSFLEGLKSCKFKQTHVLLLLTPYLQNPRPALRLVKTKELPREDWLGRTQAGYRQLGCRSRCRSQSVQIPAGALAGKNRPGWLACPSLIRNDEESPAYWGNILEPIVAAHYTKRTGNRVRRINAVLQHPDPDLAWMLANIDREVTGASDVQILECKTAGINGAPGSGRTGFPSMSSLQVHHQLAVTGKQAADVAVLLGRSASGDSSDSAG